MRFPDELVIPEEVLAIARRLEGTGFEVWCVGGAIRDNLLEIPNHDFDLATSATPKDVRKLFRRTVPVGMEHGTIAVLDEHGDPHEVTTFRKDVQTDGRHAVVEFGVSLEDDLARRDFTINAIAYHPLRHEWRDPFAGAADLDAKVVRAVGDPGLRFREDYLRILRALRFAARFDFAIQPETWAAARAAAEGLQHLSAERVRAEWFKTLETARDLERACTMWRDVGAIGIWLPAVEARVQRAADSVQRLPGRDPVLITSFLSDAPDETLRRLKCSNAEIERGRRIGAFRERNPDPADEPAVRRWMAKIGDPGAVDDLVAVARAEGPATGTENRGERLSEAVARVRQSGAPLSVGDLAVSGNDLLEIGIPEGPEVGRMLRVLLDQVLSDPAANTREALLARARRFAEESPA